MSHDLGGGPLRLHYLEAGRTWLLVRSGWRVAMILLVLSGLIGGFIASNDLPAKAVDGGLSQGGARTLAIFLAAVVLWVTEAVPLVVTGLAVFVALVAGGIGSPAQVSAWFGDRVVFFLLGIFLIAGALTSSHVVDHAALRLLNAVGTSLLAVTAFGLQRFDTGEHLRHGRIRVNECLRLMPRAVTQNGRISTR